MTQLINLATKQVCTESEFRAASPNTSFPATINYEDFGYAIVFSAPAPAYDPINQAAREVAPVLTPKGHYEQAWEVVPRFNDYTDEQGVLHTKAEQEAAAIAADQAQKLANLIDSITKATQARLDDFARTRNYDGILSACTYAASPTPKFQAEGQYCVAGRDSTWASLYQIMGEVELGQRPMPASYADVESALPELTWPV